jgi:RNA polymerase sigma-70 factor (ECF subfamily)
LSADAIALNPRHPLSPDVLAAATGDDDALAALVRAYHERVHRFGLRVCRDARDTDDAVQEAFTKLATRPDVVRDQSALSWLMTVVRNTCYRLLRPFRRGREEPLSTLVDADDAAVASPEVDAQTALERWELVAAVHAAIARLDRPYREVLVLRDLEGLSGEDASAALGVPLATMKTRLHRARALLRAEIEGHAGT